MFIENSFFVLKFLNIKLKSLSETLKRKKKRKNYQQKKPPLSQLKHLNQRKNHHLKDSILGLTH